MMQELQGGFNETHRKFCIGPEFTTAVKEMTPLPHCIEILVSLSSRKILIFKFTHIPLSLFFVCLRSFEITGCTGLNGNLISNSEESGKLGKEEARGLTTPRAYKPSHTRPF